MPGYPNLFPSGFLEQQTPCQGPLLYRNQPSREANGVRLNNWLDKYATGQYKGGDFLRLATNLRNTSRMWNRLPSDVKRQFIQLIMESDSDISSDILKKYTRTEIRENFGDLYDKQPIKNDNKMSIFIIVVIAIVCVVIGFLCACTGSSM